MPAKPATVDAYLAGLPDAQRAALEKVRRAVRAAAPAAEECVSYGVPAFRLGKALVAGFGASAGHCSFFPMSGTTIETLREDLAGYDTSKGAVRFQAEQGLPAALVRKLVKARIVEVTEAASSPGASARRGPVPRRRTK